MEKLVIMLCIFLLISFSAVPVFADSVDTSLIKYFTIGFNLKTTLSG